MTVPELLAFHRLRLLHPLLVLASLSACAPATAQVHPAPAPGPAVGEDEGGTLQVNGQARVPVDPDQVRISFAVETEASTAAEATRANAERMDRVVTALRSSDMPTVEVETFGYSLRPEYERNPDRPGIRTIVGYRARNNIRVTLRELEATGRVLDRAVGAGANEIASLRFEASDTRQAGLRALSEAVHRAREQAETMAEAMGVALGPATEVTGGTSSPSPGPEGPFLMRAAAETTTPVEAGTLTASASVSITYRILGGRR